MKFLCLFNFAPNAFDGVTPQEMRRLDDATIEHDHKLRRSGHLLLASPLEDVATERVIDRRRHLKVAQTDGPFAEAKEVIGGVVLIEAKDMDEALALFADDPIAAYCRIRSGRSKKTTATAKPANRDPNFAGHKILPTNHAEKAWQDGTNHVLRAPKATKDLPRERHHRFRGDRCGLRLDQE